MTHLPMTQDLQRSRRRETVLDTAWRHVVTVATNPDLLAVVIFCLIGLAFTVYVLLHFPDITPMTDQIVGP
jgi:hypothetical protein